MLASNKQANKQINKQTNKHKIAKCKKVLKILFWVNNNSGQLCAQVFYGVTQVQIYDIITPLWGIE